jgi:hypothetical protein
MPAQRVTTVTVPLDVRSAVALRAYRDRTPLLTIRATRPALLVTLTLPERVEAGHVEFARQLAVSAAAYAVEVTRRYRRLPQPDPDQVRRWRRDPQRRLRAVQRR